VGEVKQVTTVSAEGPIIEMASANLGAVINNRQVTISRWPAATLTCSSFSAPASYKLVIPPSDLQDLSGTAYFATNGASDHHKRLPDRRNSQQSHRARHLHRLRGTGGNFNVQANTYDAEFGHRRLRVNVSTKGGTTVYMARSMNSCATLRWMRTTSSTTVAFGKPPYNFNQFGLAVGGPVIKNHLFFFANYEGIRTNSPAPGITTVPTDLQRRGIFLKPSIRPADRSDL